MDDLTNPEEFLDGTDPDKSDNLHNITLDIPGGWSMISIPLMPEIASVSELFSYADVM